MNEEELLKCVLDAAKKQGWFVAHFRPARTLDGWRTAVQADGKGWPDLVLVRRDVALFRELKGQGGRLTPEQKVWLEKLEEADLDADVWTSKDWESGRIVEELL